MLFLPIGLEFSCSTRAVQLQPERLYSDQSVQCLLNESRWKFGVLTCMKTHHSGTRVRDFCPYKPAHLWLWRVLSLFTEKWMLWLLGWAETWRISVQSRVKHTGVEWSGPDGAVLGRLALSKAELCSQGGPTVGPHEPRAVWQPCCFHSCAVTIELFCTKFSSLLCPKLGIPFDIKLTPSWDSFGCWIGTNDYWLKAII